MAARSPTSTKNKLVLLLVLAVLATSSLLPALHAARTAAGMVEKDAEVFPKNLCSYQSKTFSGPCKPTAIAMSTVKYRSIYTHRDVDYTTTNILTWLIEQDEALMLHITNHQCNNNKNMPSYV
ncbi:hypothetical protein GOP47_0007335 [Adiantum capillus-veneris]|uniref:Uncharacterized protein n=1 Tax=Adiantum capillus-veneris TaxID=13818 RepID=A0A9D4V137_ADICA|nr:hypothetical protein GOP47_0007335 [Adiantum capillus-veneris]